jgi:hypothetical protein
VRLDSRLGIGEQEIRGSDEVVDPPHRSALPPRPHRMLDRPAPSGENDRRIACLQAVTSDAHHPWLSPRTMGRHMDAGNMRIRRKWGAEQSQRRLVAEELAVPEPGDVLRDTGVEVVWRGRHC